jgi:hypothetical protein
MTTEMPNGNLNAAYCARHTYKHTLISLDRDVPTIKKSLAGLWELRYHPHYEAYPHSTDSKLKDLIGGFDAQRSEISDSLGFPERERRIYRSLAGEKEYERIMCEPLTIPDVYDVFKRGILTDAVTATREKILLEYETLKDEKMIQGAIERLGLDIGGDELREMFLDRYAYAMFIVGATFPHLIQGTLAEQSVEDWFFERTLEAGDTVKFISALIGKDVESVK